MKRLIYILSIIFLSTGCEKSDSLIETDDGRNVLGFYLDGEKISYKTSGGIPSEYSYEHCVYARWINSDSLEVSALLDNYYYDEITIKIAVADISTQHDIIDPDVTLSYLYRKYPLPPGDFSSGGTYIKFHDTEFVSGKLSFRKWDQTAGILSGNFHFECDAQQYDGSTKRLSVTKGNFDVQLENRNKGDE